MAYLFEVREKTVFPNAETLMIEPFKTIWNRDKSKDKVDALSHFAYIEFVSSMKKSNPYRQYPESRKAIKIAEDLFGDPNWKPDVKIRDGIMKMRVFQQEASTTYNYYLSAKIAAEGMQDFFRNADINERHPKSGNPIYKPRDFTSALNDTGKVLANLKDLEKKVEEELYEEVKTRSDKQVSPLADPGSLRR